MIRKKSFRPETPSLRVDLPVVTRSEAVSVWGDAGALTPLPGANWSHPANLDRASSEAAHRALELGYRAARRGRLHRAEKLARWAHSSLRQRPGADLRSAVVLLGQVCLARGRPAEAGPLFHAALATAEKGRVADPIDIEAFLWLGLAAFIQGDRALSETRLAAACRWARGPEGSTKLEARCRGFLGWVQSCGPDGSAAISHLDHAIQTLLREREVEEAVAFDALCAAAEGRWFHGARAQRRLASARVTSSRAVLPLLELAEALVSMSEAHWALDRGDTAGAETRAERAKVLARDAGTARLWAGPERHVQRALLAQALNELRRPRPADHQPGRVVEVAADGAWFRAPDSPTVGCERRPVLRRLLVELARQRIEHPGRPIPGDELFAAGWPDQRISVSSAKNRLKVAISTLRKMGFGGAIVGDRSGYRIDPRTPIRLVDSAR